ncbi:hypothetical protein BABINDRAFT_159492 [Babjeviella inositovora NRRL Y-12698]|uniref:Glycine cleavage system P protein n=1 Tax=Babjeviella inositovora NRRL Y-12698 TaxID=984486 RepID=A0A1E3QZF1_9ASCO|nr:uncharacterized protein BABINDRAFT_159492 [Babjeviella inositovora NRRL Y-12698]ODQ83016.1 hypothetical protein BABINDRAFT_159492 [Babjeviella inositovora NRRL Y-12698]
MYSRYLARSARSGLNTTSLSLSFAQRRLLASSKAGIAQISSNAYSEIYNSTNAAQPLKALDTLQRRHLGPTPENAQYMLGQLGYSDLEEFTKAVIPEDILVRRALKVSPAQGYTETEMIAHLREIASKNKVYRSFIGKGYYNTIIPPVVQRNVLECPEWYTSYTPYQPEVSQGRLQSLLNFQTVVCDLTGLPVANASLLDEATAGAEAVLLSYHSMKGKKSKYVVDTNIHAQTLAVIQTRANTLGIEIVQLPLSTAEGVEQLAAIQTEISGALVQYPATDGSINSYAKVGEIVHANHGLLSAASDLLALTILEPPSSFGADIVFGNSQRFGVTLGYGGPQAAFLATITKLNRKIPGRIVGVSKDRLGNPALRLALQTREQHIKREKATSNICTAQALLANMAAMYAVYHGPEGLKNIAKRVFGFTSILAEQIATKHTLVNKNWFDTLTIELNGVSADALMATAVEKYQINLFKVSDSQVSLSLDESVTEKDLTDLVELFTGSQLDTSAIVKLPEFYSDLTRSDQILSNPIFNTYHSETSMLRYIHSLQTKDISLANSMIPLGSCTMKLNATVEMLPITWPEFANIHPFAPDNQCQGYAELIDNLEADLADITGFASTTLQPNSGAQGEYTGLSVIKAYFEKRGETQRNICLIPVSAHGTNPASAAMAGMKVVAVKCLNDGSLDLIDLKAKAVKHADNLAAAMITYPSTYGLFEPGIRAAISTIHEFGGQVYLDGANMNAQVGLTSPGDLGADVCHLNLHKTFCIPHGGGGPGVGPICVAEHLTEFLPSHPISRTTNGSDLSIKAVSAAAFGSASILPISYAYIKMMGANALPFASSIAMLNSNYMLNRLQEHYSILFVNSSTIKHCAHEFILDLREFKANGIEAIDVAKRLQDYGFHAPTMSFPVPGTLMIEPTESEDLAELDRFCDSLISIKGEINAYINGDSLGQVLKNAPHSLQDIVSTTQAEWDARGYTREQAAYPLPFLQQNKFWTSVSRLDDAFGDMNLMCTCPSVEEVAE